MVCLSYSVKRRGYELARRLVRHHTRLVPTPSAFCLFQLQPLSLPPSAPQSRQSPDIQSSTLQTLHRHRLHRATAALCKMQSLVGADENREFEETATGESTPPAHADNLSEDCQRTAN